VREGGGKKTWVGLMVSSRLHPALAAIREFGRSRTVRRRTCGTYRASKSFIDKPRRAGEFPSFRYTVLKEGNETNAFPFGSHIAAR
jgi:hypothetical protein